MGGRAKIGREVLSVDLHRRVLRPLPSLHKGSDILRSTICANEVEQ